jgi:hypothetical protein
MSRLRQSPLIYGIATLVAATVFAEGWLLINGSRTAKTAALTLTRRQREWRRLAGQKPPPTTAQADIIEADLARAGATLAALEERLSNSRDPSTVEGATVDPAAISRTDAFIDLADFVRSMREQAGRAGVGVRAEEYFGFSTYAHEGPASELIALLLRQRRLAGYLLENLFASRPERFVALQRARLPKGRRDAASASQSGGAHAPAEPDVFAIDSGLSIREPDVVETTAFRVTFAGYTAALRGFLNRLAAGELPVVVRGVEVEPVKESSPRHHHPPGSMDSLSLIVRPTRSRFSVTVEFCEIIPSSVPANGRPVAEAARTAALIKPCRWTEPAAQRRGHGWVYDVFTPPSLYYDPRARLLSAMPAAEAARADPAETAPDLELLTVRRGPFRLQLVGYAGWADDQRGIFANIDTGKTVIGREGERLSGQGLTVKSLSLKHPGAGTDGSAATGDLVATAIVTDELTEEEMMLTNREQCLAGAPVGLFVSRKTPGLRRELREGESLTVNGVNYCIERIDLQPPQVVVVSTGPGEIEPRIRTFTPQSAPMASGEVPVLTASDETVRSFQATP